MSRDLLLTKCVYRLPKIASDSPINSYIQKTKQGAQIDPSMLIKAEDRKLANGIRIVEDPIMVKAKAEMVSFCPFLLLPCSSMRKISKFLDAGPGPVLGTTLHIMISYFHSYTEKALTHLFLKLSPFFRQKLIVILDCESHCRRKLVQSPKDCPHPRTQARPSIASHESRPGSQTSLQKGIIQSSSS